MLAASHAAPWRVAVRMPTGQTDAGPITLSTRRGQRNKNCAVFMWMKRGLKSLEDYHGMYSRCLLSPLAFCSLYRRSGQVVLYNSMRLLDLAGSRRVHAC